jgi:hypothetical protein
MNITKLQRITLVQLWNKVCKDRGWSASDRSLRLATMGELLGRAIASMDDIGRTDECTKVMNGLNRGSGVLNPKAVPVQDMLITTGMEIRKPIAEFNFFTPHAEHSVSPFSVLSDLVRKILLPNTNVPSNHSTFQVQYSSSTIFFYPIQLIPGYFSKNPDQHIKKMNTNISSNSS